MKNESQSGYYEKMPISKGTKVLFFGAITTAFVVLGLVVANHQNKNPASYEMIDQTDIEYAYVIDNVDTLAQDWTDGLAHAGLKVQDGVKYSFVQKRFVANYVDRETGLASISFTAGKGKIAAYVCEQTANQEFLFHEFSQKGKMIEATNPLTNPTMIKYCKRSFEVAGLVSE